MRRHATRAALAALACAPLIAPLVAYAASALPKPSSPLLWATVDVCDSAAHPDTIGIRGSMPGTGDAQVVMYMKFNVEYQGANGQWHYLGTQGQSGLVRVGNGSSPARQAGQDFEVSPSSSHTYVLRGVVVFEWQLHGVKIATYVRATRTGHTAAAGADPPGYSAATCRIRARSR